MARIDDLRDAIANWTATLGYSGLHPDVRTSIYQELAKARAEIADLQAGEILGFAGAQAPIPAQEIPPFVANDNPLEGLLLHVSDSPVPPFVHDEPFRRNEVAPQEQAAVAGVVALLLFWLLGGFDGLE